MSSAENEKAIDVRVLLLAAVAVTVGWWLWRHFRRRPS
jgi:predicted permease